MILICRLMIIDDKNETTSDQSLDVEHEIQKKGNYVRSIWGLGALNPNFALLSGFS